MAGLVGSLAKTVFANAVHTQPVLSRGFCVAAQVRFQRTFFRWFRIGPSVLFMFDCVTCCVAVERHCQILRGAPFATGGEVSCPANIFCLPAGRQGKGRASRLD
jgi:hypothetical protein